jgi:hypothetical protein
MRWVGMGSIKAGTKVAANMCANVLDGSGVQV